MAPVQDSTCRCTSPATALKVRRRAKSPPRPRRTPVPRCAGATSCETPAFVKDKMMRTRSQRNACCCCTVPLLQRPAGPGNMLLPVRPAGWTWPRYLGRGKAILTGVQRHGVRPSRVPTWCLAEGVPSVFTGAVSAVCAEPGRRTWTGTGRSRWTTCTSMSPPRSGPPRRTKNAAALRGRRAGPAGGRCGGAPRPAACRRPTWSSWPATAGPGVRLVGRRRPRRTSLTDAEPAGADGRGGAAAAVRPAIRTRRSLKSRRRRCSARWNGPAARRWAGGRPAASAGAGPDAPARVPTRTLASARVPWAGSVAGPGGGPRGGAGPAPAADRSGAAATDLGDHQLVRSPCWTVGRPAPVSGTEGRAGGAVSAVAVTAEGLAAGVGETARQLGRPGRPMSGSGPRCAACSTARRSPTAA